MLKIMLVDDHEVVRLGIKALLSNYPAFEVVTEASDADEAVSKALEYKPDVIIMDIRLPGRSGIVVINNCIAVKGDKHSLGRITRITPEPQ